MSSHLDARIEAIIEQAASDIASAVRANIAEEVQRVLGGRRGARAAGRGGGRRAASAPRARRGVSEAQLKSVLDFIGKNPGKRGEQIRAALKLSTKVGGKILAKLRQTKAVKTKGQKRSTTYSAA
jgi:hypothetical protein